MASKKSVLNAVKLHLDQFSEHELYGIASYYLANLTEALDKMSPDDPLMDAARKAAGLMDEEPTTDDPAVAAFRAAAGLEPES